MASHLPRLVVAVKDQTGWPVTAWASDGEGGGVFAGRLRIDAAALLADASPPEVRITPQLTVTAGDADELAALAAIIYCGGVEADSESTCVWYKILRCSDSTIHTIFEAAALAEDIEEDSDVQITE
ncbi:hypothetical protein [Paramicrobacterium agarici]|uniref:Uncharacterized protein n=1 Tax=Paramicrobacterium agarici TaxID=630514 RepID=A0A2A9DYG3_9MICO|nr:hypothetical protein [Microbacterium agarici]PFG31175.1 hypothetical protein ATJ78_2130 [Microbacterium agarici]